MLPTSMQIRMEKREQIAGMIREYQRTGTYIDVNGKVWKGSSFGIILAWEEYEKEFNK